MATGDGLGRVLNVIYAASGVEIPLTNYSAVTFVSYVDAGTHTLAFEEHDSTDVNTVQDLDVAAAGVRAYAGPGIGGTWAELASSNIVANDVDGADGTADCYAVTIRADQLSDGYDSVECTGSAGAVVAILHDLRVQRKPGNLKSSLVA